MNFFKLMTKDGLIGILKILKHFGICKCEFFFLKFIGHVATIYLDVSFKRHCETPVIS